VPIAAIDQTRSVTSFGTGNIAEMSTQPVASTVS
jgi:hypothetical protein